MIRLKNVTRTFDRDVLKDINIDFEEGKIYVIKGVSGCGKTTLLNILAGIDNGFKGEYIYNGLHVENMKPRRLAAVTENIGYITQESMLIGHLTVNDNLLLVKNDKNKINTLAESFNVNGLLDKYPGKISGGERQRIALIRALLYDNDYIIADEPTASLDSSNAEEFVDVVKKLKELNKTVIISSHKDIYDDVADCVIDLDYGSCKNYIINEKSDEVSPSKCKRRKTGRISLSSTFNYAINGKMGLKQIFMVAAMTAIMLVFIYANALSNNIETIYRMKFIADNKANVLPLRNTSFDLIKEKYPELKVYYNYSILEDEKYTVYPLFDAEDSIFNASEKVSFGHFPTEANEVIVTDEYVYSVLQTNELETVIGKEIVIKEKTFVIAGILNRDNVNYAYRINYFYSSYGNNIFVPYDTISNMGLAIVDNAYAMVVFDIKTLDELEQKYPDLSIFTISVQNTISQSLYDIDFYTQIIKVVIIVVALVAILFIVNQISINLYYKKRSIGYLQLFGIKKGRIRNLLIISHVYYVLLAEVLAIILYYISYNIILSKTGYDLYMKTETILIYMLIVIGYAIIVVLLPTIKLLRKPIISLIRSEAV